MACLVSSSSSDCRVCSLLGGCPAPVPHNPGSSICPPVWCILLAGQDPLACWIEDRAVQGTGLGATAGRWGAAPPQSVPAGHPRQHWMLALCQSACAMHEAELFWLRILPMRWARPWCMAYLLVQCVPPGVPLQAGQLAAPAAAAALGGRGRQPAAWLLPGPAQQPRLQLPPGPAPACASAPAWRAVEHGLSGGWARAGPGQA